MQSRHLKNFKKNLRKDLKKFHFPHCGVNEGNILMFLVYINACANNSVPTSP